MARTERKTMICIFPYSFCPTAEAKKSNWTARDARSCGRRARDIITPAARYYFVHIIVIIHLPRASAA